MRTEKVQLQVSSSDIVADRIRPTIEGLGYTFNREAVSIFPEKDHIECRYSLDPEMVLVMTVSRTFIETWVYHRLYDLDEDTMATFPEEWKVKIHIEKIYRSITVGLWAESP